MQTVFNWLRPSFLKRRTTPTSTSVQTSISGQDDQDHEDRGNRPNCPPGQADQSKQGNSQVQELGNGSGQVDCDTAAQNCSDVDETTPLISRLSDRDQSYLCRQAVKINGLVLNQVPMPFRDFDTCKLAVKNNGLSLQDVPTEMRNAEMCRLAVKSKGLALKFVPVELKTMELCLLAVKQNPHALQNIWT